MSSYTVIFLLLAACAILYILRDAMLMKRALTPREMWVRFEADDPLMLAAAEKARATLADFDMLREKFPHYASLALGPLGANGDMNPVLVRGRTGEGYLVRRARNNPQGYATEEGPEFACKAEDIVDWIVYESIKKDRIHGGFTLRAVVDIARRDRVPIPPHVLKQEEKFVTR